MINIIDLKEWVTVSEAAAFLSNALGSQIAEADVLQLALNKRLKLSVNFVNGTTVRRSNAVSWMDTTWLLLPILLPPLEGKEPLPKKMTSGDVECPPRLQELWDKIPEAERKNFLPVQRQICIDGKLLSHDPEIAQINGVWDLPMVGSERLDIEHQFQLLTGGPAVTTESFNGVYVEDGDGVLFQIQEFGIPLPPESETERNDLLEHIAKNKIKRCDAKRLLDEHNRKPENDRKEWIIPKDELSSFYGAAETLPADCVLVVRTAALRQFEVFIKEAPAGEETDSPTVEKPAGHLDHDLQWQQQANEIAAELRASTKRSPTKGRVAKDLAKKLGESEGTVERRTRKQWK